MALEGTPWHQPASTWHSLAPTAVMVALGGTKGVAIIDVVEENKKETLIRDLKKELGKILVYYIRS